MKDKFKKLLSYTVLLLVIYPFGLLLALTFKVLQWTKIIKIKHFDRFPHCTEKIILIANHPSMMDPFLMSILFSRGFIKNPFKFSPLNVPDKRIFYDSWYWFWLRPILIPVDRTSKRAEAGSLFQIKSAINCGRVVVIFPEGGRTFKGEHFIYSRGGKRIRTLKGGVGWLALKTGALVVPVWIEGSDKVLPNSHARLFTKFRLNHTITIKIGNPTKFAEDKSRSASRREQINQEIASSLLELADEEE